MFRMTEAMTVIWIINGFNRPHGVGGWQKRRRVIAVAVVVVVVVDLMNLAQQTDCDNSN